MGKIRHSLVVSFISDDKEEIYRGTSYINKRIKNDEVVITSDSITISFERWGILLPESVLDSPQSIIRRHLKRALLYYLAVTGHISECSNVTYSYGSFNADLEEKADIIRQWKNYKVSYTLSPEVCEKLFSKSEEVLAAENVISFLMKSQLSELPHDAFRAAWSSLNAIYTNITGNEDEKEEKKLTELSAYIKDHELKRACDFIESVDNSRFWKDLNWYGFMEKQSGKKRFVSFFQKHFAKEAKRDALLGEILYSRLYDKIDTCASLKNPARDKRAEFFAKKKDDERYIVPINRVEFLVCCYCYYKRNRSVHAGQAYPLFIISERSENYAEPILAELLWNVITDIIEEKYAASES